MKVIPFNVPKTARALFRLQVDRQAHLYDKLHQHAETQIMHIVRSEGTLIAGDYIGRFREGDLFLIGSRQPHVFRNDERYYDPNHKTKVHAVSVYFDERDAGETFWQLTELNGVRSFLQRAGGGYRIEGNTRSAVIALLRELGNQAAVEKLITFLQLLDLLSKSTDLAPLAMTSASAEFSASEGKRMNEILQFTFRESQRKIYIGEVAEIANLTPEAFCRYFKLRTGKTYTNFLNEVRISGACRKIISSGKSIQEISFESGFQNLSHFNRVFKKVTGKTPKGYLAPVSTGRGLPG